MIAEADNRKRPVVVVGAGMATHALLRRLASGGGLDHYAVTVVGEEPRPSYDRVNLTDYFSGKSAEDLLLSPREWYAEHGVEVLTGVKATGIDRTRRLLRTDSGDELPYDLLVLATGSRPFVPPMPGVDLPGVFVYRTVEDLQQIRDYAGRSRTAAVLGGGLLGLEAGKAVYDMKLEAHVFEVAPGLMPRQLNAEAAELLKDEVEALGVQVHLLRRAERIEADGDRRVLHFHGHDPVSADMVIISAGIRPRDELAREAGLAVGERGGVVVDAKMRTDDPRVFAIGECASFNGNLYGLVGPCYDMAEVVADNLIALEGPDATDAQFTGASTASRLKLMGVDVSTLGVPIGEAAGAVVIVCRGEGFCRSLMIEDGRLVGAIGVGDWPERERLSGAIADRQRVRDRQTRRFKETGSFWAASEGVSVLEWPAASTVCSCLNVTRGELTDAMQAGAARGETPDAEALAEATGASTVCGSCRNLLCELAGQPEVARGPKGRLGLLVASCLVLIALPVFLAIGPVPFADSVQSEWRGIEELWKDSFAKQVTGYSLLGVSVVSLTLSLRKRMSWFKLGDFSLWRGVHGILGALTIGGFLVHTGLHMGHNFTFVLAATFLLLNLLGAFTGVAASLESRFTGAWGQRLRAWRPKLTQAHIWLFWPIPALVLFHIISVYYY
ncbi:MAG: FAD-dependent oxidoreductase [Planctomycetota bacterium]